MTEKEVIHHQFPYLKFLTMGVFERKMEIFQTLHVIQNRET